MEDGLPAGFDEAQEEFERPVVEQLVTRKFRDAAFAGAVKLAYGDRCAITGNRFINGGGRAEVQAAHIRPVAANGPDSVRNGMALSGTVHWLFDRGLVSVADDHTILIAHRFLPEGTRGLVNGTGRLLPPERPELQPHPTFLRHHREHVFKGE